MTPAPNDSRTYEVLGRLGGGGMADVFLALMRQGNDVEKIALKRIRTELESDLAHVLQFEREARLCSQLKHENIVGLKAFGTDEKGPYLALELVDGASASALSKALTQKTLELPVEAALSIARDAALGLMYAHEAGIVHRDISPDNLLISRNGVTKISDFGIAKSVGATQLTRTGAAKGKLGYIAPELFEGAEPAPPVDIFALGATLYRIICGTRAFEGRNEAEILRAVLHAMPAKPTMFRKDLPPDLSEWMMAALSKSPQGRPPLSWLLELVEKQQPRVSEGRDAVAMSLRAHMPAAPEVPQLATAVAVPPVSTAAIEKAAIPPRGRAGLLAFLAGLAVVLGAGTAVMLWPKPEVATVMAPPPPEAVAVKPEPEPIKPEPEPVAAPAVVATKKAPKPKPTTLKFKVSPWGRVFVDGAMVGVTPFAPVNVTPGEHSIIVVNEELSARQTLVVKADPNRETEVRVALDRKAPSALRTEGAEP